MMKLRTLVMVLIAAAVLSAPAQAQRRQNADQEHFMLVALDTGSVEDAAFGSRIDAIGDLLYEEQIRTADIEIGGSWMWLVFTTPAQAEKVREMVVETFPELQVKASDKSLRVEFADAYLQEQRDAMVRKAILVLEQALAERGLEDVSLEKRDQNGIYIQSREKIDRALIDDLNRPNVELSLRFVLDGVEPNRDSVPPGASLLPTGEKLASGEAVALVVSDEEIVGGEFLEDAQATVSQGYPVIAFTFDQQGARKLCEATEDGIGRRLAIVLDGSVLSSPTIRGKICGGRGQISGNFTVEEAQEIAARLRSGDLPVPLTIVETGRVGAD